MARLASINLNKRLGNPAARARLTTWLRRHEVDILLAQEPWKPVNRSPIDLAGYRQIGGDGDLFCWIAERHARPPTTRPSPFLQRIELGWLAIYNIYLDCRSTSARAAQLVKLRESAANEHGRPLLVCGDFNLAPRPVDGIRGDDFSTFNTATDRTALAALLAEAGLVDLTATDPPHYTIERQLAGTASRFRCDLALSSDHLGQGMLARYDDTVRGGDDSFTDHSGILIDVPVTPATAAADEQDTLFSLLPDLPVQARTAPTEYRPHKTAMGRSAPSPFARAVVDTLVRKLGITSVLDHGCGRGSDVNHYRSAGLDAAGWDPHPGFGYSTEPQRLYDLVTNVFVLNVLADPWQRIKAVQHAATFVRPGGSLLVVTRSPADIDPRAAAGRWLPHHDGYWSSESKGTFQKGIAIDEILALSRRAGLTPAEVRFELAETAAVSHTLLTRPA